MFEDSEFMALPLENFNDVDEPIVSSKTNLLPKKLHTGDKIFKILLQ